MELSGWRISNSISVRKTVKYWFGITILLLLLVTTTSAFLNDPMDNATPWYPYYGLGDVCTNTLDTTTVKSGPGAIKVTCQFNNTNELDYGGIGRDLIQSDLTGQNGIGFWSYNSGVKPGHINVYLYESLDPQVGYYAVSRDLDKIGWEYSYVPFLKFQPMTWVQADTNAKMDLDKLMWMSIGLEDDYSNSTQHVGTGEYVIYIDNVKSETTAPVPTVTPTPKAGIDASVIITSISLVVLIAAITHKKI